MTFLYFAYGSNMLPARLLHRCPSARGRGIAVARDFGLAFTKPSDDRSGKATLVASVGATVPGVLFEIDLAERDALDRYEGVGHGYKRTDDFSVVSVPAAGELFAVTYFSTATDTALKPFDWYLAVVIAGAIHHGLDAQHVAALRTSHHVDDVQLDRPTRRQAIDALLAHGIADYRTLLGPVAP